MAVYHRLNPRLFALAGLLALLLVVLAGGLAWRQIFLSSSYEQMERVQILRRVLQPGPRGRILDRQGRVLVDNRARYSVVLYVDELRKDFRTEFSRLRAQWLHDHNDDTTEVKRTINSTELAEQARLNVAQRYLDQANELLGRQEVFEKVTVRNRTTTAFELHFEQNPLLPFVLVSNISATDYARFNEQIPVESPLQTNIEALRYYPYGSLGFHTLGYVGYTDEINGEDLPGADLPPNRTFTFRGMEGRKGLEATHNDQLTGEAGGELWKVDPSASLTERIAQQTPKKGADLVTSLDLDLQQVAEAQFHGKGVLGNAPFTGAAVALDVRTGEVLAMASTPDFNLNDTAPSISNKLNEEMSASDGGWENRATQGLYPAASTFKIVDTIAGLRNGLLSKDTLWDCPAQVIIGGRPFREDSRTAQGNIGVVTAIQNSSDVFFYKFGIEINHKDPSLLAKEAHRLGFGERTNILDLGEPAESTLIIPDPAWKKAHRPHDGPWSDGDAANLAVGQGYVQVTPLEMACFIASVARNETRTKPTLLHNPDPNAVVNHGGEPLGLTPEQRQLLLTGMEAVTNTGTGTRIHYDLDNPGSPPLLPGIRVAGKTGTAQRTLRGKAGTIAWFICFAPIENPRIAIAVAVESLDAGDYYGGRYSTPIARRILEEYFKHYPDALPPKAPAPAK